MKVAKAWLKELVDLKVPMSEIERLLPLRTIAIKEATDRFIELDMKGYNRADLLSMRGVAYEVAAISNSKVKFSEPDDREYLWSNQDLPAVEVEVQDEKLCPLYAVAKISGLKVAGSNKDITDKLQDAGLRPVNNLVDITNLVMLEYGQPLHAFDAAKVVGEKIIVRTAKIDEEIETLDAKKRLLSGEDLLIADSNGPIGIAGVMGGKNSEVGEDTESIFLEAAIFDPMSLRRTATSLGIQSEASKRFYHGLTRIRLLQALDAAIRLYQSLGGKLEAIIIRSDTQDTDIDVVLRQAKVNSLIGIEIDQSFIEDSLSKLYFEVARIEDGRWKIMPPYWRKDIQIEEDLIEEVARIYGYEKIPAKPLEGVNLKKIDQSLFELIARIKQKLVGIGLTEVSTYSFYSTAVLESLGFDESNEQTLIKVANPISAETEYLRQNIWPNLTKVIDENMRQGFEDIAIFEVGRVYNKTERGEVVEEYRLSIALMNGTENPMAELNSMFNKIKAELDDPKTVQDAQANTYGMFHPVRFLKVMKNDWIGGLGEVHKAILDKMGIGKRVAVLEVKLF